MEQGQLSSKHINEEQIQAHLYAPDMPYPDLIIRTSGEQRLSNFLLWQCAYSELEFLPIPWPEFNETILHKVCVRFAQRERRYGLTSAQLSRNSSS